MLLIDSKIEWMYNNEYMVMDTDAYAICLCPTLSGMLQICEEYAFNYKNTLNTTKSQVIFEKRSRRFTKFNHERLICEKMCASWYYNMHSVIIEKILLMSIKLINFDDSDCCS